MKISTGTGILLGICTLGLVFLIPMAKSHLTDGQLPPSPTQRNLTKLTEASKVLYAWTSPARPGRIPSDYDTVSFGAENTGFTGKDATLGINSTYYTGSGTLHYEPLQPLKYYVDRVFGGMVLPGVNVNLLPGQQIIIA